MLAGVGILGITALTVGRCMPESGARLAMGAIRRGVVGVALVRGILPVGVLGALVTTGFLESVLYGVAATDAVTFASVGAVLAGVAVVTVLVPAWRASRVDPVSVLGSD